MWHIVYLSRIGKTKDKDIEIHFPGSKDAAQKAKTPKNVQELLADDYITHQLL